jgi:DNA invertase Pin-like site-specific DNA recombinase
VLSSCETQRGICSDFATARGWVPCDELFDDPGESSESLNRPALRRLLRKIEQGQIDRIVVYGIDRLTRKLYDLHKLLDLFERHDVELSVVTDPNFGESAAHRLTSNIVAAASEFQLELTRERMADARAALKREGRRVAGRVPFGYRADGATKQLVVQQAETAVVRRMFELAAGGKRPQEIADQFNQLKLVGARGQTGSWTARHILKLLSNPIYTGAIHDGAGTLPGRHEAIVTPAMFDQVRESIESRRSRAPGRTATKINWPLRGLLVCGECGRVMSPSISGYKNFCYRYYRCRSRAYGRPPCKDVGVSAFEIEDFVRTTLSSETWQLSDPANAAAMQEFATTWRGLDNRQQMKALTDVLQEVRFDPNGGRIWVNLADGALERIRGR